MMNMIRTITRKMRGLSVPSEVVCQPQKYRLQIWLRGDPTPMSYLQVGEESIRVARMFVNEVTNRKREWWNAGGNAGCIVIRCADVSLITLNKET